MAKAKDFGGPYPGARPGFSYLQHGSQHGSQHVFPLTPTADGTWSLWDDTSNTDLDVWLAAHGEPSMAERVPVLSYGSNACPSKLVDLRGRHIPLTGPVPMTRCTVVGLAAAWCNGARSDGAVPATLAEAAGTEEHFIWWVAPDQWAALDACEGRSSLTYSLVALNASHANTVDGVVRPVVQSEGGIDLGWVFAYVGTTRTRRPMPGADGGPLLVRDLDQASAVAYKATRPGSLPAVELGKVFPYGINPTRGNG